MKWGVLSHVDTDPRPGVAIEQTIRLARVAEDLGFDSFWIAQHRFGDQRGVMPSPLVLLAALARETDRIELGTASIAAAFEDPRRLVEDAAVVDALTSGRLQLGLGSGSSPRASAAWGLDHDDRRARFWRTVDDILGAADGIGAGERHTVVPSAAGLRERTWITSGSAGGVRSAADRGLGLIVGRRSVGPDGPRAEDERVAGLVRDYRRYAGDRARVALSRPIGAVEDLRDDPGAALADHILIHNRPHTVPHEATVAGLRLVAERMRG
ncbi:LLM class flavin-dependent oxidoreductase [Prescottella subtropica]|uniref:LLM class flavin-dependent oxidoreductase n=1 Tax=Prescottella subtropica TaxID=2545757 RepID=UPI001386E660|nr:LLM class flavin-dependent oxidoreductase [Prescottella subtropica]